MPKQIYTMVCSRCKHVKQVQAESDSNAKSRAGKCESCAQKNITWSTWHISR